MTTFAELDLNSENGLPVYAVQLPDERYGFDESQPRIKINALEFIYASGTNIGQGGNEGQTRRVKLIGYFWATHTFIRT